MYRQCKQKNLTQPHTDDANNNINITNTTSSPTVMCREPWSNVPDHTFPNMWRIVYWTSQFLTW